MSKTPKKGFITPDERSALGWLWRGYLRQRMGLLGVVAGLVILQSAANAGFVATLGNSFGTFFDATNGTYLFNPPLNVGEDPRDANGDGVYEVELVLKATAEAVEIRLPLEIAQNPKNIGVALTDGLIAFDPVSTAKAQGIDVTGRDLVLEGPDARSISFKSAQTGRTLAWLVGILAGIIVVRAFAAYGAARLGAWIATRASLKLRQDLVGRLLALDLAYFDSTPTGRLVLRLYGMVTQLEAFFSTALIINAQHAITILFVLGYLLWTHAGLFIFVLIALPCVLLAVRSVTMRIRVYATRTNSALAVFLNTIETTLAGVRTIKLTNQEPRAQERLQDSAREIANLQYGIARNQAMVSPFVDLIAAFFLVLVIGLGGYAVISGWAGIDARSLVTFAIGLSFIFDPARVLSRFNALFSQLLVSLKEIHEMDQQRPLIFDDPEAKTTFDASGDLVLEKVEFAYSGREENPLFKDLSMTFPGGKTSALVGQTGSGKTTIFSLIARLYEPSAGRILVGDEDIAKIQGRALRDAFSVVSQDIFIFDASIEENIHFVAPDADAAAISYAAAKAQLTDLIAEKAGTTVGPRGAQLSGGQKQRIAIARAFLTDAPIVLLDEATSALDQQTEAKITQALKELCEGRTTLIIAHRLSTITHADEIFVLDQGQVAEQGNHEALLRKRGLYAALFEAQQSGNGSNATSKGKWWQRGA